MESHLPCYILGGILGLLLVVQQFQHIRITAALHDRILESKGLEPVPPVETINKMIEKIMPERTPYNQPKVQKEVRRIHFDIPGMPKFTEKK